MSDQPNSTYPYRPLDTSTHEIRLLNFVYPPSDINPSANPTFTLTTTSLTASPLPSFTALSYTWGDPTTNTATILIDTHSVRIRQNLHQALTRLRHDRLTSPIWIDAICINQSDTDEKNTQVPLMREIYSRAMRVFAWLGPGPYFGALGVLRTAGEEYRVGIRTAQAGQRGRAHQMVREVIEHLLIGDAETAWPPVGMGLGIQLILKLFLETPWWRRVWVVQEVVLAKQAMLLCGGLDEPAAPWDEVREAMTLLSIVTHHFGQEPSCREPYQLLQAITVMGSHLWHLSDEFWESGGTGLPLLLVLLVTSIAFGGQVIAVTESTAC
ncbi:heterokaryon incompatibility protein-domain-containing protein [Cercophora newfieldiana]|uniref:Heterokaryon incompatibility protein-domain-containing protein n=1 Tax=Cercophora newfieldiana TaxID=92897 RepID=A0AA39YM17_9PEZI|nr:heterokaryon incompatibility protein-domain-containing protein [Cercophora newfieldiana]